VNSQSVTGHAPLWWAVACEYGKVVSWLILKNVNQHIPDNDSVTPLAIALLKGHKLIIKILSAHASSRAG